MNLPKPLRSTLAAVVSLSIALAAPGSQAYAGLAQQAAGGGAGVKAASAPRLSTLPAGFSLNQFGVPQASRLDVGGLDDAGVPQAQASAPLAALAGPRAQSASMAALPVVPGAQPFASAPETMIGRLSIPLPDLRNASQSSAKSESEADFMLRALGSGAREEGALPLAAEGASGASTTLPAATDSGSSRGTSPRAVGSAFRARMSRPVAMFAAAFGATAMFAGMADLSRSLLVFPIVIVSLIMHEIGHARAAARLGDPSAVMLGRGSFDPRTWKTHIDPVWTIAVPLLTLMMSGFIMGGARPVEVNTRSLKDPVSGMALVAVAGPAVNVVLAGLGAVAFAALGAVGAGPALVGAAGTFTIINAMLAVFNLTPAFPFDGHHILRWLLPSTYADQLDRFYRTAGMMAWIPGIALIMIGMKLGVFAALNMWIAGLLVGGAQALVGLVAAAVPAAAALGIMAGQVKNASAPQLSPAAPVAATASAEQEPSAELVVIFDGAAKALPEDLHLSFVDVGGAGGVALYAQTQQRMLAALENAGITADVLASYNATPVATYRRINAATLRLDASKAQALADALRAGGFRVFSNSKRRIVDPMPMLPEDADPLGRGSISMDENLAIMNAVSVQAIADKRWGNPNGEGRVRRFIRRLMGGTDAPQVPFGVIDTGADIAHPFLKDWVDPVNVTSADDKDDNGHGTWTVGDAHNVARHNRIKSYKTFVNGGATLDDILKALTAAGNDGNIVISNSWGSDDGDPNSPDSELVRKLAEEGHIMVFAAGNAGPRPNTVGSPAIMTYKTADGAPRIFSVAAAGRDKKIAYFSSRGPGSPATKNDKSYSSLRPDGTALGYNTEGPWLTTGGADRIDPVKGPVKAISGTSMAAPSIAGAIVLLAQLFNVTAVGPRLDAVVRAVWETLEKTGQPRDAEGGGFIDVEAAYKALEAMLGPAPVPPLARRLGSYVRWKLQPKGATFDL